MMLLSLPGYDAVERSPLLSAFLPCALTCHLPHSEDEQIGGWRNRERG